MSIKIFVLNIVNKTENFLFLNNCKMDAKISVSLK